MNDLTISTIMQDKNKRRFQELLSEAELERRYRQQTPGHAKLWQRVTDHLIAAGKQLKRQERQAIKPACTSKQLA